jgi:hypothetical protein
MYDAPADLTRISFHADLTRISRGSHADLTWISLGIFHGFTTRHFTPRHRIHLAHSRRPILNRDTWQPWNRGKLSFKCWSRLYRWQALRGQKNNQNKITHTHHRFSAQIPHKFRTYYRIWTRGKLSSKCQTRLYRWPALEGQNLIKKNITKIKISHTHTTAFMHTFSRTYILLSFCSSLLARALFTYCG